MTIYQSLRAKLGREPTSGELKTEVARIKTEAIVEAANNGHLAWQRRYAAARRKGLT